MTVSKSQKSCSENRFLICKRLQLLSTGCLLLKGPSSPGCENGVFKIAIEKKSLAQAVSQKRDILESRAYLCVVRVATVAKKMLYFTRKSFFFFFFFLEEGVKLGPLFRGSGGIRIQKKYNLFYRKLVDEYFFFRQFPLKKTQ